MHKAQLKAHIELIFQVDKINIYLLAKEASLDRTTLQKTVKGQRLPSFDYIKDICRYIKISKKQEEELFRLYQIEKLGAGIVKSWDEINQILVDIQGLRQKKQSHSFLNIHFDRQSYEIFNEKDVQFYSAETETIKAIMCMIEQEIMEEKSPEIYMDASWATPYVLSQLVQSENIEEKSLVCHQLVNLRSTDSSNDGVEENFRILHQVIPYAFVFHKEYDMFSFGFAYFKYESWVFSISSAVKNCSQLIYFSLLIYSLGLSRILLTSPPF